MAHVTFEQILQILWSFCLGLADSLRGAVDLFLLDSAAVRHKEKKMVQRDLKKEVLLNRDSPARDIVGMENFAKKRALERRERAASTSSTRGGRHRASGSSAGESAGASKSYEEPRILERTLKCCMLNGCVFWASIVLFEQLFLPSLRAVFYVLFGSGSERAEQLWSGALPLLSFTFSALWVVPFYLLSRVVNAIWFQDIADSAFRSSRGRPQMMSSISVMIADTVFSLVVESVFLVQAKICSFLPIKFIGNAVHMVHLCLLFSLYSFEYKWFNQGLELHKRLTYVENNWPYFLGFGFPLAVLTSMSESVVVSGCVFSILFPLFIVSGNQAQVVMETIAPPLHIFHPTIAISNAIFDRTFRSSKCVPSRSSSFAAASSRPPATAPSERKPTISFANSSISK